MFEIKEKKEAAERNLSDMAKVLDDMHLTWWYEAGSCLGMVRDGGLIAHDSDTDIGVLYPADDEEIERRLVELGFSVFHRYGRKHYGCELSFVRDGVKCDIFWFYHDGEKLWHAAWRKGLMIRLEFDTKTILPTKKNLPKSPQRYLTARYGEWKKPNADWRWDRDPLCINWDKSEIKRAEV
jgi:hypothetical protein